MQNRIWQGYRICAAEQPMADTLITKKLMTSKVFSQEVVGQTSSNMIHRDVEKSINKTVSVYIDQWYRDNPLRQF